MEAIEPLTLTVTQFQRQFKKARQEADSGFSVLVQGDGTRYVFEKYVPNENPFEGMEHIFGPIKSFPKHKRNGHKTKKTPRSFCSNPARQW